MTTLKTTPIHAWHIANGARMVDFTGWDMPVQYEGILGEHKKTRENCGIFDVSHMGEFWLKGKDALTNLCRILPNDPSKLKIGQVQYSPLLYTNGTCVDDLSVYRYEEDKFMLCVNASNVEKDFKWIKSLLEGEYDFENRSSHMGQIALQGRNAEKILAKVLQQDESFQLKGIKYWWFNHTTHNDEEIMVARMGYTGENGFEIFCSWEKTLALWEEIMEAGKEFNLEPVGLGARDTLRLEVGYPLYGHEIDDQHIALEHPMMKRFIKMDGEDFIGKEALQSYLDQDLDQGIKKQLVGLELVGKGIPRDHYPVLDLEGNEVGEVTSGNISPQTGKGVAMAYVPASLAEMGQELQIQIRKKAVACKVVSTTFYKVEK